MSAGDRAGWHPENETNQMWREVHAHVQRHRNAAERRFEARIAKLALAHRIEAFALGEYGWRLIVGSVTLDYWPRTGTWRAPDGTRSGHGWTALLSALGVRDG